VKSPSDRLTRAKVSLLLDHPFFGTLATRLTNVMDPTVETACTNGKVIKWSPRFLATLTDVEVRAVLAHEVMHVAYGHTWRRGTRDATAWNISTDLAINHIITEADLKLPACALFPTPSQANKSAETLYAAPKPAQPQNGGKPQPGQGQDKGQPQPGPGQPAKTPSKADAQHAQPLQPATDPGGCGGVEDAPDGETGALEQEAEWKVAIAQAAMAAKSQGKLPGSLARMVEEIVNPRVAWEVILRDFVERTARNDYNWSQPNRRYLSRGIILPSLISEELPAIVVAIDTSGSIGKAELDQFAAEVSAVLGAYETTIHIVYCDAWVTHTHTVTRAELPLTLEPKGGGGTDFRPVFRWIEEQQLTPAALVYLTDLMGTFPPETPEYPVLWVATTDQVAPMGETIQMN
jgi:predicted metal-dependent peptidase